MEYVKKRFWLVFSIAHAMIPSPNGEGHYNGLAFQMCKPLIFFLVLSIATMMSQAQTIRPLTTGNRVPDIIIGYNVNNPSQKTKLSGSSSKLVLLNFFSSNCGSCMKDLKKLDSMQEHFGNSIKILNITKEEPGELKKNFARRKWSFPKIPLWKASGDLLKLFPYESIPHHVWLDSNFKISYITIGANANPKNISRFLSGEKMDFVTKSDLEDFDENQPLWLEGNGRLYNHLQYYSFIMKKISGFNGHRINRFADKSNSTVGFKAYNIPLLTLIKSAWGGYPYSIFSNNNRVALEISDPAPFTQPTEPNQYKAWEESNAFCYVLSLPDSRKEELYQIMQQDISRFFNYDIKIEKRKTACLVLVRTSAIDRIRSTGFANKTRSGGTDSIVRHNITVSDFVRSLNTMNPELTTPFIDGTNYTLNVDLKLGAWYTEIEKLRTELRKYDLDLVEEERTINILVIRDKKEGS